MIKAVIFDCFGVLTTDLWREFTASLPNNADIEAARRFVYAYDEGKISQEEFVRGVKEVTGQNPPILEKISGEVAKNSLLLQYIRELRSRGFKIGLLSNVATGWIRESLLTEEEKNLFDEMIFSFEVGIIKPDPRIFMLMDERLP